MWRLSVATRPIWLVCSRQAIPTRMDQMNARPGSRGGIVLKNVMVPVMAKTDKDVVMIRARVQSASPERTQYKPYSTTLTFDDDAPVYVEIPVPAEHVTVGKGGVHVLTLEGWTIFLDVYASAVEKMNEKWTLSKQNPAKTYRPY